MEARKETTVKEAEKKAADVKNAGDLKDLIVSEVRKMVSGEQHSVQQAMAYARRLDKMLAKKDSK